MDFSQSPQARQWHARLEAFMDRYLLPYNAAWHQCVNEGVYPPPFIDDLKALAKEEGLWNMFLPDLKANEPSCAPAAQHGAGATEHPGCRGGAQHPGGSPPSA